MIIKSILALGIGFTGGWITRSLGSFSQGVGVKLLEVGLNAKRRVAKWAALEGERLDDMLAEARSRLELEEDGVPDTEGTDADATEDPDSDATEDLDT